MNPWIFDVAQLIAAEQAPQAIGGDSKIYANVVSTLAFLLAGTSLIWQYHRSLLEKPKLTIEGGYAVTGLSSDPKNPKWAFNITVANTGHKTASVKDIGWQIERKPGGLLAIRGELVPTVPMRLEGLDSQDWEILCNMQGTLWKGLRGRPYAVVVARPTKREAKKGIGPERTIVGDWYTMDYDPKWLSTFMNPQS